MEAITGSRALIRYPGTTDDFVRRITEPRRTLSTEVVSYVCSFLSVSSRVITSFVCKKWCYAATLAHTSGPLVDPRHSWITSVIRSLHQIRITPTHKQTSAIVAIVKTLLENHQQAEALEIAHAIPYERLRSHALFPIALDLTKTSIAEAGKLALMIPDEEERSDTLLLLTYELLIEGNIKGAMEIALLKNPNTRKQTNSILTIIRTLLRDHLFREAQEFADTIPFEGAREKAFSQIASRDTLITA